VSNFADVFKRIKGLTDIESQADLASYLNVKDSAISKAKAGGEFPLSWSYKICKEKNLSLDYVVNLGIPAVDTEYIHTIDLTEERPNFRTILTKLMKDHGLTDKKLAGIVGVQISSVQSWKYEECDYVDLPTLETLLGIAVYFDIKITDLLGGEEPVYAILSGNYSQDHDFGLKNEIYKLKTVTRKRMSEALKVKEQKIIQASTECQRQTQNIINLTLKKNSTNYYV